jgi:cation diffusion facilitator CzcD-associated flavoprotein CzcO
LTEGRVRIKSSTRPPAGGTKEFDVEEADAVVVGAGQGGIYHAYRLAQDGLSVIGIDGGYNFGGVWCHNRYPGARVDSDSVTYCFQFSRELYSKWRWPERYADADYLFDYHSWVADELDVRRIFRFNTWVREARWSSAEHRWHLRTDQGDSIKTQFLVMCTGALAAPKPVTYPGLETFAGDWVQTSRWPADGFDTAGRRVAIIGTGSSGVQCIPAVAANAERLVVFQRHPHWAIPAQNRATEPGVQDAIAEDLSSVHERAFQGGGPADARGSRLHVRTRAGDGTPRRADEYTEAQRVALMEEQWELGGHGMTYLFADGTKNIATNEIVQNFVREKIRSGVRDQRLAEKLLPEYPFGTKRLILEIGYYESLNQDNVQFVDILGTPIVEVTNNGIRTTDAHYDVDLIIFATGFRAFIGPLEDAGIRNEGGETPKEAWARGPRTLFGLMTPGFPNMFHSATAGSPSVLENAMIEHEFMGDWIAGCIAHVRRMGHTTVEASGKAADEWMDVVDDYARRLFPIRRLESQYMVHVNEDGTRKFIPFCAGMGEYVPRVQGAAARGYEGFVFA